jgi:hypothetical protein
VEALSGQSCPPLPKTRLWEGADVYARTGKNALSERSNMTVIVTTSSHPWPTSRSSLRASGVMNACHLREGAYQGDRTAKPWGPAVSWIGSQILIESQASASGRVSGFLLATTAAV